MKPILHTILAMTLLGTSLIAAPVNERQARTAAEAILVIRHPERNPELARTMTPRGRSRFGAKAVAPLERKGTRLGHVVTLEPGGYLLLRADDELSPLKLHSENGDFGALPPGFREVIELEMAEENSQLREIRAKGVPHNLEANRGKWMKLLQDPEAGDPQPEIGTEASPGVVLLTTTWDQGTPYNLYCPTASGGPGGRAYAGCTAAALSQLLKYHGQPAAVLGDYSYTDNTGSCTGTHSISDAGLTPYAWAEMPSSLTTSSPSAQQQAVARLMYHAAVALDSDFEGDGTGAWPQNGAWQTALTNSFGYTCGSYEWRSAYTNTEWFQKITADITANKPVLYAMWAVGAGHAVVCDG